MSFIDRTTTLRSDSVTRLTDEDLRRVTPSAFAARAHESRRVRGSTPPDAPLRFGGFVLDSWCMRDGAC
jgi:hypothetical protein